MNKILELFPSNKQDNFNNIISRFREVFNRIWLPYYSDRERANIEAKKLLPDLQDDQRNSILKKDMHDRKLLINHIQMWASLQYCDVLTFLVSVDRIIRCFRDQASRIFIIYYITLRISLRGMFPLPNILKKVSFYFCSIVIQLRFRQDLKLQIINIAPLLYDLLAWVVAEAESTSSNK